MLVRIKYVRFNVLNRLVLGGSVMEQPICSLSAITLADVSSDSCIVDIKYIVTKITIQLINFEIEIAIK